MLATILLLAVGLVQDDWTTFEPESKTFRVALPAKPSSTTSRSVSSPAGEVQLTSVQTKTPDGVYSIQATENPARVNPKTLDDGIRQFAATKKATLGPLKSVTVGGNPGREFEMTEGPKRSKLRFVASGSTLIVLSAAGMPGAGVPAGAERFLESLAIGPAATDVAAEARPRTNAAEAKARADEAKVREAVLAESKQARVKAEAELARAKAELARAKTEAEIERMKAETERTRAKMAAKATTEFADTPDASVSINGADKGADDAKDPVKSAARKASPPVKVTISRLPKGAKLYADQDLEDLSKSFSRDREGFRDIGPEGSVLVGVRVTYIERFGGPKVRSAQPIYRSGTNYYAGRVYGEVVGPVVTVVARPDYAVGGLVTHTGLTVDGFGIVFMKVDGDHLDPNDTYNSPWIGDRKGGSPGEVTTRGGLIVGLQGKARDEVNALGLTSLR